MVKGIFKINTHKFLKHSSFRAHLIKGLRESVPNTEEELIDPKYSYKVLIFQDYLFLPNMQKFKSQDRLVVKKGLFISI